MFFSQLAIGSYPLSVLHINLLSVFYSPSLIVKIIGFVFLSKTRKIAKIHFLNHHVDHHNSSHLHKSGVAVLVDHVKSEHLCWSLKPLGIWTYLCSLTGISLSDQRLWPPRTASHIEIVLVLLYLG